MTRNVLTVLFNIIGLTQCGSALNGWGVGSLERGAENTRDVNMIYEIALPF